MPATNRIAGTLRTYNVSTKPVWGPVIELVDLRYCLSLDSAQEWIRCL